MEIDTVQPRPQAISIGKRLKEAREKKSLTIEQVQKQTKIHSTVLIALEEGRAHEILTDTYVRSFLKKYAQALGLPAGEILKEFFPPNSQTVSPVISAYEKHFPEETRKIPKTLYFTGIAVLIIASLLMFFFIAGKTMEFFKKSRLLHGQKKPSAVSIPKAKSNAAVKPANKKKSEPKTNAVSKEMISKNSQLNVVMKIKEPVIVKLTKDGVVIYATVLSKGTVETIKANESIKLEINKGNAVELALNGRPISLKSKNKLVKVLVTRKGVTVE